MSVALGPFTTTDVIGKGGMARVWAGEHAEHRIPVAIKVLDSSQDAEWLAAFRAEIRAVAGLDHPHVVWVLDHGVVGAEAARASGGALPEGAPYLVMERARTTLHRRIGRLSWETLREVLEQLLSALAHAHARGVIHRDLKPANVLVGGMRPGIKLSDFGLAHLVQGSSLELEGHATMAAGTPNYMAPEQFMQRERDYGPWTDLYAVGRLAWVLATGAPPHNARGIAAVIRATLHRPLPRLTPRMAVPSGFEDWLRTLLARDPHHRFQRAADAAHALAQLAEPDPTTREPASAAAIPHDATTAITAVPARLDEPPEVEPTPTPVPRPPPPPDWHRGADAVPPVPGAGLGLYGLRDVPFVGRQAERDELWGALLDVVERSRPRALLLEGPSGCGKSRLARWLTEEAHATGIGTVMRAIHGPTGGPHDGLAPMCARALSAAGLAGEALREHLARRWPGASAAEHEAMEALIAPEEARVRVETARQRWVTAANLVAHRARERTVVLWLDDVQWGSDAVAFASSLLDSELGVLLVLTVRTEALADRPVEAALLSELRVRPAVAALKVPPLSSVSHDVLVRRLLGLSSPLATSVATRTAGNPLFAVQLIGDWVERGLLEPGPDGYALRDDATVPLPDDLHGVWAARVARLARSPAETASLELAAVLGQEVDQGEWRAGCAVAGLDLDVLPVVLDRLLAARLAVQEQPGSWAFVHGMLRESLLRLAEEAGRAADHHRACAAALQVPGHRDDERIAHHLLGAGARREALPWLLKAMRLRFDAGEAARGAELHTLYEDTLRAAGVPEDDPAWGEGWIDRGSIARLAGDHPDSLAWCARAIAGARAHGWDRVLARALFTRAFALHTMGELDAAVEVVEEAYTRAVAQGDHELAPLCHMRLALTELDRGNLDRAQAVGEAVLELFIAEDRHMAAGNASVALAGVAMRRGHLERARALATEALEHFTIAGSRLAQADALNYLGETTRQLGDLEAAEAHYRACLALYTTMGASDLFLPQVNLALVQLARGQHAEAHAVLEECLVASRAQRRPHLTAAVHAFLASAASATGDWAGVDHHLALAEHLLAETRYVDPDVAAHAEQIAARATDAGLEAMAARATDLAARQWAAMGRS